jgi:hypothetical protein
MTLNELVCDRADCNLKTVMTTNLPKTEFRRRYGARVMDRLEGDDGWAGLGGESMR